MSIPRAPPPKRWHIAFIRQFMTIIGPISSIYDFLNFRDITLGISMLPANSRPLRTGWLMKISADTDAGCICDPDGRQTPVKSRPSLAAARSVLVCVNHRRCVAVHTVGSLAGILPAWPSDAGRARSRFFCDLPPAGASR